MVTVSRCYSTLCGLQPPVQLPKQFKCRHHQHLSVPASVHADYTGPNYLCATPFSFATMQASLLRSTMSHVSRTSCSSWACQISSGKRLHAATHCSRGSSLPSCKRHAAAEAASHTTGNAAEQGVLSGDGHVHVRGWLPHCVSSFMLYLSA
jgi:hypothetical protein